MLMELKSRLILEFETSTITRKEIKNMNRLNHEATTILIFVLCKIDFLRFVLFIKEARIGLSWIRIHSKNNAVIFNSFNSALF